MGDTAYPPAAGGAGRDGSGAAPCQVCGGGAVPYADRDGHALVRCRDCGLIYLDPMPSPAKAASFYVDAYDGATSGYFAKPGAKLRRARGQMRRLARLVPAGRFLDVGCNGGFAVEAARLQGFEAHGLELDPVSIAYARDRFPRNVYFHGPVESYRPGFAFDAVHCSEVIEHVADVNGFVAAIAGLMRPGAVLHLTTPDIGHWRRPRDLARWDAFCPPAHCLYFSPANLARLLARHGLVVIKRRFAWKPGIKLFARKQD
ncbi:MAG: class I SAM-dependent methyltransferase [Alphaproteobacteria bacterium]|jgi:SAM-dependent methyltransferase|nr:class I SAM-dependent methyltransferase [Alphaproteobacteria bacterium]MDP6517220.1 class I SAM-dependent methyltransferase [Alphaproteobacteria bacterium]